MKQLNMIFRIFYVASVLYCVYCNNFHGQQLSLVNLGQLPTEITTTINKFDNNYYNNAGYINGSTPTTTLQLVHVIFRHGSRTPVNTYPNDPYINHTFYPYGWGHLTNKAKKELFYLGQWLRKRYHNIIYSYYTPDLVHAQASSTERTLMSMATLLAGMFPPKNTPMEWQANFNWQPIPILTEPIDRDIWLRMTVNCPRYNEALQEVLQSVEIQNELKQYEHLFKELTVITGINVTTAHDIASIYITLLTESEYGLSLPYWTRSYYPYRMQYMAEQSYIYNGYTTEMQRLKAGPILLVIMEHILAKIENILQPNERKIYLYCAHDWTITNILLALKVWKRQMPGFAAMILIELHRHPINDEYYLKVFYKNDAESKSELLILPGCIEECPLTKVLDLIGDILPTIGYNEMCLTIGQRTIQKYPIEGD